MRPPITILAGGKGTRLEELTVNFPKPMVPVLGKPFLYWLIKHYVSQGFEDITVSTSHKASVIESYPWPKEWKLKFFRDPDGGVPVIYLMFFDSSSPTFRRRWVVNGDTYIPEHLPYYRTHNGVYGGPPVIMTCGDVDAGAHYIESGKTDISPVKVFYDIGTPLGLDVFKQYAATHLDRE